MPRDEEPIPLARIIRSLETLQKRHAEVITQTHVEHDAELKAAREKYVTLDDALLRRDCLVDALDDVIVELCARIERTYEQLRKDNNNATYSDPLALMYLIGREHDPKKLKNKARENARKYAREEKARQEAEKQHKTPDGKVACQCGKEWPQDRMREGHNLVECFRACRVCGHHEDSHVEELPEEGGRTYCREDAGMSQFAADPHTYDGAICADWDVCACGHSRREHRTSGREGAHCQVCHPEHGRLHEFVLKR